MWLSGCAIVLSDQVLPSGALRIEDGHIAELRDAPAGDGPETLDVPGMMLLPGIVDLHGDMIEREIQPRPGALLPLPMAIDELDKRHASAGVTTGFAAVSFSEDARAALSIRSEAFAREMIGAIHDKRPDLVTDLRIHARFEVTNTHAAPILRDLLAGGAVDLVSLTDHTPGQGQYRDIERLIRYRALKHGLSLAESTAQTEARIAKAASHPVSWDTIRDVTHLAAQRHLPIASHDDDTLEKVALMHDLGATISEFPITLEVAEAARFRSLVTLMGAPNALRGKSNSGNLSAREALQAGALDALASDYHPAAPLHAAFTLAEEGLASLPQAISMITAAPAQAGRLDDRGTIVEGKRADLVLCRPGRTPRVRMTLRGGKVIHMDGMPVRQCGSGETSAP